MLHVFSFITPVPALPFLHFLVIPDSDFALPLLQPPWLATRVALHLSQLSNSRLNAFSAAEDCLPGMKRFRPAIKWHEALLFSVLGL